MCVYGLGLLVGLSLVYLLTMHHQTSGSVQLSWTMTTFEVLGLLMLQEDCSARPRFQSESEAKRCKDPSWRLTLLVFKLPLTVPTPRFEGL